MFTDNGSNFASNLFKAVCSLLHVGKTHTTPYRPQSNAQCERVNRSVLQLIRCYVGEESRNWDKQLQLVAGALRSTVNRRTGFTPNMMMLGREVVMPADLVFGGLPSKSVEGELDPYVTQLGETLKKVHELARSNLQAAQHIQKKTYDRKACEHTYEVGDLVYKLDPTARKLNPVWKGPFLVTKKYSPILFEIRGKKKSGVIHHDRLTSCNDRDIPCWMDRLKHKLSGQPSESLQNDQSPPRVESAEHMVASSPEDSESSESSESSDSEVEDESGGLPYVSRRGRNIKLPLRLADYLLK